MQSWIHVYEAAQRIKFNLKANTFKPCFLSNSSFKETKNPLDLSVKDLSAEKNKVL